MGSAIALTGLALALVLYLLPSFIAGRRQHESQWAIFSINILLGWTVLGWLAALIWACSGSSASARPA